MDTRETAKGRGLERPAHGDDGQGRGLERPAHGDDGLKPDEGAGGIDSAGEVVAGQGQDAASAAATCAGPSGPRAFDRDDRPTMPPMPPLPALGSARVAQPAGEWLRAICVDVADRAQDVAWQAYLLDQRPSAMLQPGRGVVDAYTRLGAAVRSMLDALAAHGHLSARWRDQYSVNVTFTPGELRVRAHRQPYWARRHLRIVLDTLDARHQRHVRGEKGRPRHEQQ